MRGLYELALFAGAGGGILGGQLLDWRCIGAVERDDYCRRVLLQRQRDGILPPFPIWNDMRTFTKRNNNVRPFIKALRQVADRLVITAGFPCQPFSVAGKRQGADDDRNGWPWTIRSIREIRPAYALLENVPGLLTSGYFDTILGDLAACGYDANWRVLSAAELGAPHQRDRLWIVAYPADTRRQGSEWTGQSDHKRAGGASVRSGLLTEPRFDGGPQYVPDAECQRVGWGEPQQKSIKGARNICNPLWWAVEPELGRVANGVAHRVDRLKAIGNGQVSPVVRAAWHLLRPLEIAG